MKSGASRLRDNNEIPSFFFGKSNPLAGETVYGGQFGWGGRLLKSNGGAQR